MKKTLISIIITALLMTVTAYGYVQLDSAELMTASVTEGVNLFTGDLSDFGFDEGVLPEALTGTLTCVDDPCDSTNKVGMFSAGGGDYISKTFAFAEALPAGKYCVSFKLYKDSESDITLGFYHDGGSTPKWINGFDGYGTWREFVYFFETDAEVTNFGFCWRKANLYFDDISITPISDTTNKALGTNLLNWKSTPLSCEHVYGFVKASDGSITSSADPEDASNLTLKHTTSGAGKYPRYKINFNTAFDGMYNLSFRTYRPESDTVITSPNAWVMDDTGVLATASSDGKPNTWVTYSFNLNLTDLTHIYIQYEANDASSCLYVDDIVLSAVKSIPISYLDGDGNVLGIGTVECSSSEGFTIGVSDEYAAVGIIGWSVENDGTVDEIISADVTSLTVYAVYDPNYKEPVSVNIFTETNEPFDFEQGALPSIMTNVNGNSISFVADPEDSSNKVALIKRTGDYTEIHFSLSDTYPSGKYHVSMKVRKSGASTDAAEGFGVRLNSSASWSWINGFSKGDSKWHEFDYIIDASSYEVKRFDLVYQSAASSLYIDDISITPIDVIDDNINTMNWRSSVLTFDNTPKSITNAAQVTLSRADDPENSANYVLKATGSTVTEGSAYPMICFKPGIELDGVYNLSFRSYRPAETESSSLWMSCDGTMASDYPNDGNGNFAISINNGVTGEWINHSYNITLTDATAVYLQYQAAANTAAVMYFDNFSLTRISDSATTADMRTYHNGQIRTDGDKKSLRVLCFIPDSKKALADEYGFMIALASEFDGDFTDFVFKSEDEGSTATSDNLTKVFNAPNGAVVCVGSAYVSETGLDKIFKKTSLGDSQGNGANVDGTQFSCAIANIPESNYSTALAVRPFTVINGVYFYGAVREIDIQSVIDSLE